MKIYICIFFLLFNILSIGQTIKDTIKLKENIKKLKLSNDFNSNYIFMIDMSISSGKKRFFIYNIKRDSIESSSLVSNGSGSYIPNCDTLIFSNAPNSHATSLGKYKIGNLYYGEYGISYKLYGLDSTNNKAFERNIVLHSDNRVPEYEVYPMQIFQSQGCPTVPSNFLYFTLSKYIKNSDKPILLWIYN